MRAAGNPKLVRLLSIGFTFAVWEWFGRGINPLFFSYPTAIVSAYAKMISSGQLQTAFASTAAAFLVGFGAAIVMGVLMGLLMGRYRLVDNLLDVQVNALYSTPTVAIIPLIILWVGLGPSAKVIIVFLAAFFPILVNTYGGVRNVSRSLIEVVLVERATQFQAFTKVIVPASVPFIMTGIRLAVGRSIVGVLVAEFFTSITGLGGLIVLYGNLFQTDKLLAVVLILAALGVVLTEAVKVVERRFASWKETERA